MKEKKKQHGIYWFFLMVITLFTAVNLTEFVLGTEPDGRRAGLAQLETVQDSAVTVWGGLQKAAGKRLAFGSTVYEDVTLLDNHTATMADKDSSVAAAVTGATQAKALADEIGADFYYVQVPGKELSEAEFPYGVVDYSVSKYDTVVEELSAQGIEVLPMREVIQEDAEKTGREWMDYFYKTDHHWQNRAAFLAYAQITQRLEKCGFDVNREALGQEQYEKINYENVFLGTHGRMAGPLYTGLDDYELWLPGFETSYTLDIPSQNLHKEGSFEDCFVHYENLAHYSYDYYAYYAYLKEDYDYIEIRNQMKPEGAHVVIVRDSEAVPVSVFLAAQCRELDIVDLRYQKENHAADYIREKQPDMIIYLFGTGYLGNETAMRLW